MSGYRCNGKSINIGSEINRSGEGIIYKTNQSGVLAKIYHQITPTQIEKLKVMVKYPPTDPTLKKGHVSIAWPKGLLEDNSGKVVGFLMPAISDGQTPINVYNPKLRQKNASGFNWLYLHTTAMNIAYILQEIHAKNYVVGDLKPDNLLVTSKANVSIIDTDSFQIVEPRSGKIYYCNVTTPEYTPPELFGQTSLQTLHRSEFQDRFGLAIIIWNLLFGDHPFSGAWKGTGDPPSRDHKIQNGFWSYGSNPNISPRPQSIPLNILHPELQKLFRQCFNNGHKNPNARPSAAEWRKALKIAIQDLSQCSVELGHYYARSDGKCYWCERKRQFKVDTFPTTASAKKTPNRSPVTPPSSSPRRVITPTPSPLPTIIPTPPTPPPSKLAQTIQSFKLALAKIRPIKTGISILAILLLLFLGYWLGNSKFLDPIWFQEHKKKSPQSFNSSAQIKLTPKETIKKYYELATTDKKAAIELLSDRWRQIEKQKKNKSPDNWWNSIRKVEVYAIKTLNQSANNAKIEVWLKYYMKNGDSACESRIFPLIFDRSRNKWLLDLPTDEPVQKLFCEI